MLWHPLILGEHRGKFAVDLNVTKVRRKSYLLQISNPTKESPENNLIEYARIKRHPAISLIIQTDNFILWRLLKC